MEIKTDTARYETETLTTKKKENISPKKKASTKKESLNRILVSKRISESPGLGVKIKYVVENTIVYPPYNSPSK